MVTCVECREVFETKAGNFPEYSGNNSSGKVFKRYKQHCNKCEQKRIDLMFEIIKKSKKKTKYCSICDKDKPKQDFYFNKNKTFGSYCKKCANKLNTDYQLRNKDGAKKEQAQCHKIKRHPLWDNQIFKDVPRIKGVI